MISLNLSDPTAQQTIQSYINSSDKYIEALIEQKVKEQSLAIKNYYTTKVDPFESPVQLKESTGGLGLDFDKSSRFIQISNHSKKESL